MAINNGINQPLSTWEGSESITTLGTVTTGIWNGNTVEMDHGGTGAFLSPVDGSVVFTGEYGMELFAPNTSSDVKFLSQVNSVLSWETISTNELNAQSGTTYTVQLTDFGKLITFNNASAVTVTLPQQSTTATDAGFYCWFLNIGVGKVTIIKQGSETLSGNVILNQFAECKVERPTTTAWAIFGGTATVQDCFPMTVGGTLANQSYDIVNFAPTSGTILGISTKCTSLGTAGTYTVAINGSTVTGLSAIANSTTRTYTSATAANTYLRGDYITITLAGTASAVDLFATLDVIRDF
jgi:hypothetical protein